LVLTEERLLSFLAVISHQLLKEKIGDSILYQKLDVFFEFEQWWSLVVMPIIGDNYKEGGCARIAKRLGSDTDLFMNRT